MAAVAQRARRPGACCRCPPRPNPPIDSALLAALIFERGLDALGDTIVEVAAADPNARLNILAANGSQLLATTWGDTLSVLRRDDGVVLASEPYDDNPGWQEIPDRHLVDGRQDSSCQPDPPERIVMTFSLSNYLAADSAAHALRRDVRDGLTQTPKSLPPKWFYDSVGSDLFDQITRLPEYYPTRAEAQILRARSAEIAAASGADTLVELGSGTSEKTRMLLDALRDSGSLRRFIPFDVDAGVLNAAGSAIEREYPGIEIDAVCGDFEEHLGKIPRVGRRLVVFLGSTIGNLTPGPRTDFLAALSDTLQPGDSLLLGTDLVKDAGRLVRAYDDSAGVTAQFNRNVLAVVNRELDADFDLDAFEHVARWNTDEERIEMWLRAVERATGPHCRAGPDRRLRRRRGDAHRGVLQVPARRGGGRIGRGRSAAHALVDRFRW